MGAYRKLLLHNEVVSGQGANCLNDITKVLYVASKNSISSISTNQAELDLLSNFDLENQIDYENVHLTENLENSLNQHSMAYVASNVEMTVLKKLSNKGRRCCSECVQVLLENDITDDSFIEYKSEISNILPPCRSTIELMVIIDNLLNKYKSQNVSFNSTVTHIMRRINKDKFYEKSSFDQHDHKHEFIELIVRSYMSTKSIEMCKSITRLSQPTQIRHDYLKQIHRAGQ